MPKTAAIERSKNAASVRIMVVDDDEAIRDSLREAFEDAGYEIVTASNGQEALDLLSQGSFPDVVIMELVMPVLDGYRLYHAMQADPGFARIPVIVSTSSPSRAPNGAVVVPKPVKLEHLFETVEALRREKGTLTDG